MSYLRCSTESLDMTKAVISFWFRVPQVTVDKDINPPGDGLWPVLQGRSTLLSWGDQPKGTVWNWTQEIIGYQYANAGGPIDPPIPNYGPLPTSSQAGSMGPSYIGLDFTAYDNSRPNSSGPAAPIRIVVNLQSSNVFNLNWATSYLTQWDVNWVSSGGGGHAKTTLVHDDASQYKNAPLAVGFPTGSAVPSIEPDQWHYALISWDMSGSISCGGDSTAISSSFKMWFALDDVNYEGTDLPANWIGDVSNSDTGADGSAGTDPHTVVNGDSFLNTLPWPETPGTEDIGLSENDQPPGSFTGTMSPLLATNLYVPGYDKYTDDTQLINSVYQVEMAELQMFIGMTLDPADEANRRLFIDFKKGADGNPDGSGTMIPVDPKVASDALGKRPEVLLHGQSNWIAGKNTGSLGLSIDPDTGDETVIPGGQFTPTGTITKYSGPSLTVESRSGPSLVKRVPA